MDEITNVVLQPLTRTTYIKPLQIEYTQDVTQKSEIITKKHDSVAIIIYNKTRNVLIFVKQFRPPVYIAGINPNEPQQIKNHSALQGVTLELCAGVVDKHLPLIDIAREEVLEETGYRVGNEQLEEVQTTYLWGCKMTTYFCEVTDDQKVGTGGGIDDEMIDVVEMSVDDMRRYVEGDDVVSPPSFMFAMYWFLWNKVN